MGSTHEGKKQTSKQQSITYVLILLELVIILFLVFKLYYFPSTSFDFDNARVSTKNNIENENRITCHVSYSTRKEDSTDLWQFTIKQFEVNDLNTDSPKMLQNNEVWTEFRKTYEDENYILLQRTSEWDTDSISIKKATGTFVRTIQGDQAAWTDFAQYAIAQKGWCE